MEAVTHSLAPLIFLILISALGLLIVRGVFKRLRTAESKPLRLEISIDELGGFSYRQLVLVVCSACL